MSVVTSFSVRDKRTGKIIRGVSADCDLGNKCQMRNLYNPITFELGLGNVFMCDNCFRTHLCDLQHDCHIVNTREGSVCTKTGFVYNEWLPTYVQSYMEPINEPNVETLNVVIILLSYVYSYLLENSDRYAEIISEITENGRFIKKVEDAIFYTFDRVFKGTNFQKISLTTISQLFVQLIIGGHSNATVYDHNIIKVSRKKREDAILKKMRFEYGNALAM